MERECSMQHGARQAFFLIVMATVCTEVVRSQQTGMTGVPNPATALSSARTELPGPTGVTAFSPSPTGIAALSAAGPTGATAFSSQKAPIGAPTALSPFPSGPLLGDPQSSMTSVKTTGPVQNCATFTSIPMSHALNGTSVPGLSADQCQATCISNTACVAYEVDMNPADVLCWLHLFPIDITNLFGDPLITLFTVLSRGCTTTAGPQSTMLSTTFGPTIATSTASAALAAVCITTQSLPRQHASGGIQQPTLTTPDACQNACVANQSCVAYEVDTLTGDVLCWFHTNIGDLAPVNIYNDNPLITLFVISRLPCSTSVNSGSTSSSSGSSSGSSSSSSGGGLISAASSSSAPTSNQNCATFSSGSPNTNALNALNFTSITTASACQQACINNASCVAYETNVTPDQPFCWLHFNATDLLKFYGTLNVTIFVVTGRGCSTASGVVSSGTTTGGSPSDSTSGAPSPASSSISSTTTAQCVSYNQLTLTHSVGATGFPGLTATQCATQCSTNSLCVAYELDLNVGHTLCWIHTNANNLITQYTDNLITQYVVVSRVCPAGSSSTAGSTVGLSTPAACASYTTLAQTNSVGGLPQSSITSATDCASTCTNNPACVAYEQDTSATSAAYCWIHTNPSDLLKLYTAVTVTQFQVVSRVCATSITGSTTITTSGSASTATATSSCTFGFNPVPNVNSPGSTPNRATNLTSCQSACTSNLACIGIDVNTNGGLFFCYVVTVPVTLAAYPGSTHYDLVRGAGCPIPPPTRGPTPSPVPITVAPVVGCSSLRVIVGYNAIGGNLFSGATSVSACLTACVQSSFCVAFDFDTTSQLCFGQSSLAAAQLATCCVRYECANTPCTDTYDVFYNQSPNLALGQLQSAVTTVGGCTAACVAANCTRFSFNPGSLDPTQMCYLYQTSNPVTMEPVNTQAGVNLYVRKRCISTPSVPPVTTATTQALPSNYCPVDMAFVVDASGSIKDNQPVGVDDWALILTYISDIITTYLKIGINTDHVAVVLYSMNANIVFNFNAYTTLSGVLSAVQNLQFIGYDSNTPTGLALGAQLFTDETQGARTRSAKFMVLITDGVVSSTWSANYQSQINLIAPLNVTRYSVGVTTQISLPDLILFASNPSAYVALTSFSDMTAETSGLGAYVNAATCGGASGFTPPLTTAGSTLAASTTTSLTTTTSTTTTPTTTISTTTTSTTTTSTTTTPTTTTSTTTTPTTTTSTTTTPTTTTPTTTTPTTTTSTTTTPTTTTPTTTTPTTTTPTTTTSTTTTSTTTTPTTTTPTTTTSTTTTPTTTTPTTTTPTTTTPTTTTSTTTTPTTTTSTTTTPTTTTPLFLLIGEGTFTSVTNTTSTGPSNPVHFPALLANRNGVYHPNIDNFVSTAASASYFCEICSGMSAGVSSELKDRGAYPPLGFTWLSTAQNGVVSACRGGVVVMTRNVFVSLQQSGGGAYSDAQYQTSWAIFSISDIAAPNTILSVLYHNNIGSPAFIPFNDLIVTPGVQYNLGQGYSCPTSGIFFISFSVGVPAGQTAQVQLLGLDDTYEIIRTSNVQNGVTTLDRSMIVQCFAASISIELLTGQATPGTTATNLISFNVFQYSPTAAAAWGLYRTTNVSMNAVATDPLTFDKQGVVSGVTVNNNAVTIVTGGYYYVYISLGAQAAQRANISLKLNGLIVFNVLRTATNDNGLDTLGHGLVLPLKANDVLRVSSEANAALYSSAVGLHTSFIGMLLYTT